KRENQRPIGSQSRLREPIIPIGTMGIPVRELPMDCHDTPPSRDSFFQQKLHESVAGQRRNFGQSNHIGLEVMTTALRLDRTYQPWKLFELLRVSAREVSAPPQELVHATQLTQSGAQEESLVFWG